MSDANPALAAPHGRVRAWTAGFAGTQSVDGQASTGSASTTSNTTGGIFGLDYAPTQDILVGVAAGFSGSSFATNSLNTSGSASGYHFGLYGSKTWGPLYATLSGAFTHFDNKTYRSLNNVGNGETENGSFGSNQASGRLELGYRYRYSERMVVTPFAALEGSELWQDGYKETSSGIFGLTYASQTVSSLPTSLGAQLDVRVKTEGGTVWSPFIRAAWVHEFMPNRPVTASFITLPSGSFTVQGPRAASDSAKIDIGTRILLDEKTYFFANIGTEQSGVSRAYGDSAGFKMSF